MDVTTMYHEVTTFLGVVGVASGMEILACWYSGRFSYLCLSRERGEREGD